MSDTWPEFQKTGQNKNNMHNKGKSPQRDEYVRNIFRKKWKINKTADESPAGD